MLQAEFDENEMRKGFTVSERVAIGLSMEAELAKRHGVRHDRRGGNISGSTDTGETRDIVAAKLGFGSVVRPSSVECVI
jgi:ParB family chromosome partitioning protein